MLITGVQSGCSCAFLKPLSPYAGSCASKYISKTYFNSRYQTFIYTVPQKTSHLRPAIILTYIHDTDYDNLAEVSMRKYELRRCFVFPPHLSSASALPCEIRNPEDSALVHCACNSPTAAALSTSFRLNHAPNSPYS